MSVFFVTAPRISHGMLTITGPLLDHLRKSLRVTIGEHLWIGDERRRRYYIRVTVLTAGELRGRVLEERDGPSPRNPSIMLGQALLKGDRLDWVIQKATELGVASIVPIISERVVARPRVERLGSQHERWQRIGLEAAQQAERWEVPDVHHPVELATWFSTARGSLKLILSERSDADSLARIDVPQDTEGRILLLIGPEGGWSPLERDQARAAGFTSASLGPRILRAETAALAALVILQSRLGELG